MTGRILGIDAGERRIGIAISDPMRSFALPLNSIIADGDELDAIERLVQAEDIRELVVGLPLSLNGESTAQTHRIRDFASLLERRLALPVHFWDERLSTHEAERLAGRRRTQTGGGRAGRRGGAGRSGRRAPMPDTDAVAASIILQAYLDRLRFGAT